MVLTAARLVCEAKGMDQLAHLWEGMNAYLDHSQQWSIEQAAAKGFKYLVQHLALAVPATSDSDNSLVMDFAARNGHLEILKWLHATERLNGCSTRSMDDAAKNGHLEIVQWLHENRREGCTAKAMDYAAKHGHLKVVQWLHANRTEGCTTKAMDLAAQNGHLEMLEWLDANRSEGCTATAVNYAASKGHLNTVQWLCEHRREECTSKAMIDAARHGHVYILEYLGVQFPALFESAGAKMVHAATAKGHLPVLNWLISALPMKSLKCEEANGSWMDVAAEYGQVDILRWFHEHSTALPMGIDGSLPTCTVEAIEKAAGNGHNEVLAYLYEKELVNVTEESDAVKALVAAVKGGHRDCVEWLVSHFQHLYESRSTSTAVMDAAASSGHTDILQFLHDGSITSSWRVSSQAVSDAASKGYVDVLMWLLANESSAEEATDADASEETEVSPWTPMALELAATNGHLSVVQWLTEHHRSECASVDALNAAAYMDHLDIARFLYTHVRSSCSLEQAIEHAHEGGAEDTLMWLESLSA